MTKLIMDDIEKLLRSIGKEVFLKILYPEIEKDINITVEDLSKKYPIYASYTINSQRTRLSHAKKIFELNKQKEALQIIMLSKKMFAEDKKLASLYYKQL